MTRPMSARRARGVRRTPRAPSTARMGDTRPARRAGQAAPSSVTTMPRTTAVMAGPAVTCSAPTGISMPRMSSISPDASPSPSPSPSTLPNTPMTAASVRIVRVTRPREAPSVRNVPISRIRWSTVMLKELRIRKPPTNSAIPEKK